MTDALRPVPYFDLKRQYEDLKDQFEPALQRVAASGGYILSKTVEEFEEACSDYFQIPYVLGVGSGTDALVLSLNALGIGKGDEVILPSFTFAATAFAVIHAGATPVFAEVDPETYTMHPKSVEKLITKKTRALLPVHLYGQSADMDPIMALAKRHRLRVVEDTCQSHGASYAGKKAGTFGDAGCFSFYPTKNLGAMGDGGMILLKNKSLYEKIRRYRNLGRKDVSEPHKFVGWTSRLDALQAAVLQIKLKHLDRLNDNRRKLACYYYQYLKGTPIGLPKEGKKCRHVYHLFVVRVPKGKRNALRSYLQEKGIASMIHYPIPVHRQPAIKPFFKKSDNLKFTDTLCREILSLPMFPEMNEEEVSRVASAIHGFYKR